jgi:hypothetical protein
MQVGFLNLYVNPDEGDELVVWHAPNQPKGIEFPERIYSGTKSRRFNADHFAEWKWLHWCSNKNKVFCQVCHNIKAMKFNMLARCADDAFTTTGFDDWKHATACYRKHEQSLAHNESAMKWHQHLNGVSVDTQLSTAKQNQQAANRTALKKIVSTLLFLARQSQSIRGHSDDEGNFMQLLRLRATDSPELKSWLTREHRNKWLSHDVQNEILQILSHAVIRSIVENIDKHRFFAVIADESTDIAGKQQLTFVVRHVSDKFEIYEDFIGLHEIDKADSEHLTAVIVDCLLRLNLNIHLARGQGYDGAAVMSGVRNGVATQIAAIEPRAVYIHCAGHSLNLALQDCVQHINIIRDVLDLTREMINFIRCSPKRTHIFDEVKQVISSTETDFTASELSLRPLCPTRWTVRTASLSSVAVNYSRLLQALHDISVECKYDAGAKASGFLRRLESFETFFGIQLALQVFEPAEQCSKTVQAKNITAADAKKSALLTAHLLQGLRDVEKFNAFYSKCVTEADKLGIDKPRLGRTVKPPERYQSGSDGYHPQTAQDKFRQVYYQFIDAAVACITQRYENPAYQLLSQIESVLIRCANDGSSIPEDDIRVVCRHFGDDLTCEKLKRQLAVLQHMFEGKTITHVGEITDELNNMGQASMLLSEVCQLLKLYFVLPATVATAERSFSALRRVKTYLRSTMTSERLNAAMVLHVNKELSDDINITEVMREFVVRHDNRKDTFGLV